MLRKLYLAGLAVLLLAAGSGLAWCLLLAIEGNPAGLANIGKLLLVTLYAAYRLRSILARRYQIYRGWESEGLKATKSLLHRVLALALAGLACALLALAAGFGPGTFAIYLFLLLLLAAFLALEAVNAVNVDPMADYDKAS
jgi:hypothetical protein